ncbi:MAG: hypothetical protein MI924_13630, partial [Chloroflexales bacterium]|nr:hypothetical protein [Chloroflexales bacterium]
SSSCRVVNAGSVPGPAPSPVPTMTPNPNLTMTPTGIVALPPHVPPLPIQAPANDPVFVGAGDIADCRSRGDEATAKLLDSIDGTVFILGDNACNSGTSSELRNCYDPTWGRHAAQTWPSAENHDYRSRDARPYYDYFGDRAGQRGKGYYSYNLGVWHIVVLNSEISMRPFWDALYEYGADVVLNGHDHHYERLAPQDTPGRADSIKGIREFVVGAGGRAFYSMKSIKPNSVVHNNKTWGVLKMTLRPTSYD